MASILRKPGSPVLVVTLSASGGRTPSHTHPVGCHRAAARWQGRVDGRQSQCPADPFRQGQWKPNETRAFNRRAHTLLRSTKQFQIFETLIGAETRRRQPHVHGGTYSGNGVGVHKIVHMEVEHGERVRLRERIKDALDPAEKMNLGEMYPAFPMAEETVLRGCRRWDTHRRQVRRARSRQRADGQFVTR